MPGAAGGNESGWWLGCWLGGCELGGGGLALAGGALDAEALDGGGLGVPLEGEALGVPLSEAVGVAGLEPPGENEGGEVGGVPDEQADTDSGASIARAAPPKAAPRARRRP